MPSSRQWVHAIVRGCACVRDPPSSAARQQEVEGALPHGDPVTRAQPHMCAGGRVEGAVHSHPILAQDLELPVSRAHCKAVQSK